MNPEITFADTNLFLRYLTNDVPGQAEAFERLLRLAAKGEMVFVTNSLVIAEIVWTLESYYQLTKENIQGKILAILNTPGLEVADNENILRAIYWYLDKNVDFIDAFNASWMLSQGVTSVCSFDQKHFARFPELKSIIPGDQTK
jgi:predicted nucleic-acid-binding protein